MVSAPAARPGNCQELNEVVMSSTELRESYYSAGKTHQLTNWNDGKGALSAIVAPDRGSKDHGFGTCQD
jgi:hypothetical protein